MTLKDVKQTTQMSSHHLLQPPQGHHSHQGCLGNLSHREGPHSLPSHHTTRPIEWSLSSTLHLKQLLGFPSSLLFFIPILSVCIRYVYMSSFSIFLQTPKLPQLYVMKFMVSDLQTPFLLSLFLLWLKLGYASKGLLPLRLSQSVAVFSPTTPVPLIWRFWSIPTIGFMCFSITYSLYILGDFNIYVCQVSYILASQSLNFFTS